MYTAGHSFLCATSSEDCRSYLEVAVTWCGSSVFYLFFITKITVIIDLVLPISLGTVKILILICLSDSSIYLRHQASQRFCDWETMVLLKWLGNLHIFDFIPECALYSLFNSCFISSADHFFTWPHAASCGMEGRGVVVQNSRWRKRYTVCGGMHPVGTRYLPPDCWTGTDNRKILIVNIVRGL